MNTWDNLYSNKKHQSIWPFTKIVSFVNKFYKKKKAKVLEIGSGYGANIPFFLHKKFDYYGLDYSKVALNFLKKKFTKIKKKLFLINLEEDQILLKKFDLIIDRGCLVHIRKKYLKKVINKLHDSLNKNGILISTDLISKKSNDFMEWKKIGANSLTEIEIRKLFYNWSIVYFEKVKTKNLKQKKSNTLFNIVVKKK